MLFPGGKQTRHAATEIAKSLKLSSIQSGYDANNEEIFEDEPPRVDLLESYNKTWQARASCSSSIPTASPSQANPEGEEENLFESLMLVTWNEDVVGKEATEGQEHNPASTTQASARTEDPATSNVA